MDAVKQRDTRTGMTGNWQLMWLAVFIVAWMQVAVAGHQFEHSATAVADTCETCSQLERAGGAPVPALANAGLFSSPAVVAVPATGTPSIAAAAAYSPRAPPVL